MERHRINLTRVIKARIRDLYQQGKSFEEIANICECTTQTVRNYLVKEGIADVRPFNPVTGEEVDKMAELFCKGLNYVQIGKEIDRSASCVRQYIQKRRLTDPDLPKVVQKQYYSPDMPDISLKGTHLVEVVTMRFTPPYVCSVKNVWRGKVLSEQPYYDVSPAYSIESPNKCGVPDWKLELQRKGIVYYGKQYS